MEEIQEQKTVTEPAATDNSDTAVAQSEGQAQNAPSELILGKFKSVDELSKAYEELEKNRGVQSRELGTLRQQAAIFNNISRMWDKEKEIQEAKKELTEISRKYDKPEYFQNPDFKELYKEAYLALGKNLDPEKLVNLLDNYVNSRLLAQEKAKSAQNETDNTINAMSFSQNSVSSITPPKKRLDEMTPKEVDELLERII